MTQVRTFYWHDRVRGRASILVRRHLLRRPGAWRDFAVGNAGDIFARNLISENYDGATALNADTGPRLLCVGSIVHRLMPGDVACGVGSKGAPLPGTDPASVLLHALRGPITEAEMKAAGYDTSTVKWFGDPGLTISTMLPAVPATSGRVIFIPHYREREAVRRLMPRGMRMVDIDADPLDVAREIMAAELVYSSSLHGIIFAHALGRPVVMVKPATEEPLSKFEDYHLGVGLDMPVPLGSISEVDYKTAPNTPASLNIRPEEMIFPEAEVLRSRGILS